MGGDQEEYAATVSEVIEHFENICCVQVHHGVTTEVKYFHQPIIPYYSFSCCLAPRSTTRHFLSSSRCSAGSRRLSVVGAAAICLDYLPENPIQHSAGTCRD